jgi:nicotinamide-nucleotide amidase
MQAIILSVGTELTLGQTVDTNTAWLSQRLCEIGIPVLMHLTVADELEPLRREIERAAGLADVVLISGGIGPTADDLTRDALAAAMGVEIELRPAWVEQIRAFFTARGREMPQANAVQAMFPFGSEAIPNTCGTAPGIRARCGRAEVFVMPGVPREMQVMYEREVKPALADRAGGAVLLTRTIWCYGAGEADIGEAIRDLMQRGRNPTVGTTAQQTVIGVRIGAHGQSLPDAQHLLDQTVAEVRRRLGKLAFGEGKDTLQSVVAALLMRHRQTIATGESCTGGLLAKRLTDVPGSSTYFVGGVVTYSNQEKIRLLGVPETLLREHGAVSAAVAHAMAIGCRERSGADRAISITGIAGPDGGTPDKPVGLVYIALADAGGCEVTEHRLGDSLTREEVRDRTCKIALNRLRLKLL